MALKSLPLANITQLAEFDEVIDVRSPSEFALDHVPRALNLPVLNDAERAQVGTLYPIDPFAAKKTGAALVAHNIARHLSAELSSRPRQWRALVYCWRGGQRSRALTHVLREIGWHALQLQGGYKAYRRKVVEDIENLVGRFQFRIVCGPTGSGKSRLLQALARQGEQVLDLEDLAKHRGSVLGSLPNEPQPTQKYFESLVWEQLRGFDGARPVYAEAESRKVGNVQIPAALIERMWQSPCLLLRAPVAARVRLLCEDYAHFRAAPEQLCARLDCLRDLHGSHTIERWRNWVGQGDWPALVEELLLAHYDPAYQRSTMRNYPHARHATLLEAADLSHAALAVLAARLSSPRLAVA